MNKYNFDTIKARTDRIDSLNFDYAKQPKEYIDKCNLCGNDIFTIISHSDQFGFSVQSVMCNNCGLIMLNPRMTAKAYAKFYSDTYRPLVSAYHGRLINEETIQVEQKHYAKQLGDLLERIINQKKGVINLLDVGGSTGVIAFYLQQRFNCNATVIDPSKTELSNAKLLGLDVEMCTIEDYEHRRNQKFELITICQTIDHFLDIKSALKKIKKIMNPEGIIFIDIVDFRAYYLQNKSIEGSIKIDHPYYLTESTMESYLANIGFKVLVKNYASDHLHVGYVCTHSKPVPNIKVEKSELSDLSAEIRFIQNRYQP